MSVIPSISTPSLISSVVPINTNRSNWRLQDETIRSILNITLPILLLATILGCIGNVVVCWIIWNKREFHTPTFFLIMNMSISDCLILLASSLFLVNDYALVTLKMTEYQISFDILCKLWPTLVMTAYISSTMTLAAISIERYYTITARHQQGSFFRSKKKLRIVIAMSWLFGFTIASPFLGIMTIPQRFPWICTVININVVFSSTYFLTLYFTAYWCPLIVMVIMYIKIILFLTHHLVGNRFHEYRNYQANRKRHIRIIKMLILLTSIFLLFSFPLFSLYLIMAFSGKNANDFLGRKNPRNAILAEVGFLLTVISCLQNPILYFAFNPAFRKAIYRQFSCGYKFRRQIKVQSIEPTPIERNVSKL